MKRSVIRREANSKTLTKTYNQLDALLKELQTKEIPQTLQEEYDEQITNIEIFSGSEKALIKLINKTYNDILRSVKEQLHFVTKNYYQNIWMATGMGVFGLPLGVIIMSITKNAAFLAVGLPIGLSIGLAIGSQKDKKAKAENRQLQIEEM